MLSVPARVSSALQLGRAGRVSRRASNTGRRVRSQDAYRRTIDVGGTSGIIAVAHAESGPALNLEVRFPEPGALLVIVERVRRMFDLGADPSLIEEQLGADRLLRPLLARHQGIRTPGAWDGFELAVRAILGQQVSVRAATTMAGRMASMFGSPIPQARASRIRRQASWGACFLRRRSCRARQSNARA